MDLERSDIAPADSFERLRSASPQSRKRARVDDELDDREVAKELQSPRWTKPVRDETYYFSDGSCILLVEDTLFNVGHHNLTLCPLI